MKKLFLIALFLISFNNYAQGSEYELEVKGAVLTKKDGTQIAIEDGFMEISYLSFKVHFRDSNDKKKAVTITDIDNIKTSEYFFKTFKLERRENIYLVLADSNDKKMVTRKGRFSQDLGYEIFIVDNNGAIIDALKSHGGPFVKGYVHRSFIAPFIKKYFPDCQELIDRIPNTITDKVDGYPLLDDPIYVKCN